MTWRKEAIEATLIKLAHDTQLVVVSGGAVGTLKGRTAIQSERPGEWANRNPVKISKDQCQVLRLGRRNPSQGHSLQLCGKGTLGLGTDTKLDACQRGPLVAMKAKSSLGCVTSSAASASRAAILSTCCTTSRIWHPIWGPPVQLRHQ